MEAVAEIGLGCGDRPELDLAPCRGYMAAHAGGAGRDRYRPKPLCVCELLFT